MISAAYPRLHSARRSITGRHVAARAQREGKATMDVLVDKVEDLTAEVSRIRAERINILKRFSSDPVQATTDLLEDIQRRPLPSPQDIATGISLTMDAIQQNIDAEMNVSAVKEEKANENLIPDAPDAQEVLDELRADVAAARSLTRKLSQSK